MPQKKPDSDVMIPTTIRLPVELDKQVREMAARKGIDFSMLIRSLIERGVSALCQDDLVILNYENKVLVNKKLRLSINEIEERTEEQTE